MKIDAWGKAAKHKAPAEPTVTSARFSVHIPDWRKLVALDFETYFDVDYTLRKMSMSEYIRDKRFKAQMCAIKIGNGKTKVYPPEKIAAALKSIDWKMHSLLCHNTSFDGFILSHHYGVVPKFYYDTLSMARALHKNDIPAGLDDVARYYGVGNKLQGVLDSAKGIRILPPKLYKDMAAYCAMDVDLDVEIFKLMLKGFPEDEIQLIDRTIRMFCDPVLKVDLPRVKKEHEREVAEKTKLVQRVSGSLDLEVAKKQLSSNDKFAASLKALGVDPPIKISPTWLKKRIDAGESIDKTKKYTYAFSQQDMEFMELTEHLDPRVRDLVAARLAVKSTIGETRAIRFLNAGANNWPLPVLLNYYGAHTGRWSAGNKMNMQNLPRKGELRYSIIAPKGHRIVVADSGQIEARVNGWLWDQQDLLEDFRLQDSKADPLRDVYTKFADMIYGRIITKKDSDERFVGKVSILGLGFQMSAERLQRTLALGLMGPPVFLSIELCRKIVSAYRAKNFKIKQGWGKAQRIIEEMAIGQTGSWRCLHWEKGRVWLPNGMSLKYPNLRRKDKHLEVAAQLANEPYERPDHDEYVYDRKGAASKIYGGLLTENFVQALARIIVAQQLLEISNRYRVVMFTHDEVVTCVPNKQADKAYEFMNKVMATPLDWCPDLPLTSEGGHDVMYSK